MVLKVGWAFAVALLLLCLIPCSEAQHRTLKPDQPRQGQQHKASKSGAGQHADAAGDGRKRVSNGDAAAQGHENRQYQVQYSRGSAPPLLVQQRAQPGAHPHHPGHVLDSPFDERLDYDDVYDYEGVC